MVRFPLYQRNGEAIGRSASSRLEMTSLSRHVSCADEGVGREQKIEEEEEEGKEERKQERKKERKEK